MRPIGELTYNAIKNRNLTGPNGFTHKILIEGELTGFGDIESQKFQSLSTGMYGDYCLRSDGKVLVTYQRGSNIMLSVVDSEELLLASNNITTESEWVHEIVSGDAKAKLSSLLRLKSGKIMLFTYDSGIEDGIGQVKCHVSQNGLGTDFVSSIVTQWTNESVTSGFYLTGVFKPIELSNGRVLIGCSIPNIVSTYSFHKTLVAYSDDNSTWTIKILSDDLNYAGDRLSGISVFDDGTIRKLFIIVNTISGSGVSNIYTSTDDGTSWSKNNVISSITGYSLYSFTQSGTDGYNYIYHQTMSNSGSLYRLPNNIVPETSVFLNLPIGMEFVKTIPSSIAKQGASIIISKTGYIVLIGAYSTESSAFYSHKRSFIDSKFKASNISISKSHGGASTATINVDNKNGVVNPRNQDGPLYKILNLNKQVIIQQGYGDDMVDSFTGIIDSIDMSTFPQIATVSLRDNFKRALDQTITKAGKNVVKYTNQPIEIIVADLCALCGLTVGHIEPTGITIEKEFSWQSYADAIQFLSDIASFEYLCDESGKFYFRRDFQPGNMSVAWSFEEGVDITDMSYKIDDNDLYNSVRVYGTSGEDIIVYNAPFLDAAQFNILPQKVLKIDATEASTVNELQKIAERAVSTMRSRTRVINFTAIAIPHLQSGDFIQIFETSTDTHEIYRLTSIGLNMDSKKFTMSCTAYYYGDSIVPGELPDTTGTQIIDPNLNLIPEMTSNTTPSGVARASSVYKDWAATYSPWRSLNDNNQDYFWDANTKVAWLEYEFPQKMIIDKYVLRARELILYNLAMPKDFTFEAFDGTKWIVLDTRTNQTSWGVYEERSFKFTNTTAYAKYRINITRNNGYTRTQFERLKMYYGGGA